MSFNIKAKNINTTEGINVSGEIKEIQEDGTGVKLTGNKIQTTTDGGDNWSDYGGGPVEEEYNAGKQNTTSHGEIFNAYEESGDNQNVASGYYSHAEGLTTKAIGNYSHAEGRFTTAGYSDSGILSGEASHAEGYQTKAQGDYSHAEGEETCVSETCFSAHAEGKYTYADGHYSHVEGIGATKTVNGQIVVDTEYGALGEASHAEGKETKAIGDYSHAAGNNTIAENAAETVVGKFNIKNPSNGTTVNDGKLFVVGNGTSDTSRSDAFIVKDTGQTIINTNFNDTTDKAFSIKDKTNNDIFYIQNNGTTFIKTHFYHGGQMLCYKDNNTNMCNIQATELNSNWGYHFSTSNTLNNAADIYAKNITAGGTITASGDIIEIHDSNGVKLTGNKIQTTTDNGGTWTDLSISEDYNAGKQDTTTHGEIFNSYDGDNVNIASGIYSHAEGKKTTAHGAYSHAEGQETIANNWDSHAEGNNTKAKGKYSHAEGYYTEASGESSHTEGCNTTATFSYSHAEGYYTQATNDSSHAEGIFTQATGYCSHATGEHTIAGNDAETVVGHFNLDEHDNKLFVVGNGYVDYDNNNNINRSDAFVVLQNGNAYLQGTLQQNNTTAGNQTIKHTTIIENNDEIHLGEPVFLTGKVFKSYKDYFNVSKDITEEVDKYINIETNEEINKHLISQYTEEQYRIEKETITKKHTTQYMKMNYDEINNYDTSIIEHTQLNENCICSVKNNGNEKEFVGIVVNISIYDEETNKHKITDNEYDFYCDNKLITFATHGDYIFKIPSNDYIRIDNDKKLIKTTINTEKEYELGDEILYDGRIYIRPDKNLINYDNIKEYVGFILDNDMYKSMCIGKITKIINNDYLAVFKI